MISLGNIALSLKDRLLSLKSDYNVYFSLSSSLFRSKSFLRRVLVLTRLVPSSSDVGVKNLANSLTREGPMRLWGSSWMSCNLSVPESLVLRGALAFSACTCLVDPLSLGRLRGYGGSGIFATGGATGGVGSAADWQLASARRYVAVGLSSCPLGFSSLDGFDDLLCPQAGCWKSAPSEAVRVK